MKNKKTPTSEIAHSFHYWTNSGEHRISKLRRSILKRLSKQSLPLFLKGGDIISLDPIANGHYEAEIKALIEYFANNGFDNFLIDIGANIGLSSCQSGTKFSEVHMFEPNPNCVSILKINANIALRDTKYFIHEFGLGLDDEKLQLYVPYDNWGGAFVKSNENEYDDALLSSKDGYGQFNSKNYDIVDVQIKSATKSLQVLFGSLVSNGKNKGVIKIDVEGYEKFIVNAIIKTIPKEFYCLVIFENWKHDVAIDEYLNGMDKVVDIYKLESNKLKFPIAPRWLNSLINFSRGGFQISLNPCTNKLTAGTYLLVTKD